MTNYEVIRECKQAYEILNDLLDNCEYVDEEDTESVNGLKDRYKIINAMELLDDIYAKAWHKIKKENDKMLETNVVDRFGHKVIISDLIGYAYLCPSCDENMYLCEGDTNCAWWFDDKKDIDCQLEYIVNKKIKQLENELKYIKSRNEICGTSRRDLTEEDLIEEEIECYKNILKID